MKEEKEQKNVHTKVFLYASIISIIAILIGIAIDIALDEIVYSNFNPINGDFQNYNPIRRLLAGQIPYKDFAVYLGNGHMLLLSFFQLFFGNNFAMSTFNSTFITVAIFEILVFTVSYFIGKNKKQALYISLCATILALIMAQNVTAIANTEYYYWFLTAISPITSARLIRNGIVVLVAFFIWIGTKYINTSKKDFIVENKNILEKIYFAILAGLTIPWSNDGGIAAYIAISFIYFILLIKQYKTNIKPIILYTLMYIGISLFTLFIVITIITRGNPMSWLKFTLGVSSYQKWYYNVAIEKINIHLTDIELAFTHIIALILAIYYIYKIAKSKSKSNIMRYSILAIIIIQPVLSRIYISIFVRWNYS